MPHTRPVHYILVTILFSFGLAAAAEPRVLILGDDDSEYRVSLALQNAGMDVTTIYLYTAWDGANPSVSNFDVVLLVHGAEFGKPLTAGAAQAIASHVAGGGGFVATEWSAYDAFEGSLDAEVAALLPVVSPNGAESSNVAWNVTNPQHPILNGFPSSWSDPTGVSVLELRAGAEAIVADENGAPLVSVGTGSGGTVVHLNHTLNYSGDGLTGYVYQLLINSVRFAAGLETAPPTGDVLLLDDGGSEIPIATSLTYAGLHVVFGGRYSLWDGMFPSLGGFKTVVFLDAVEYGDGFAASGSTALSDFVNGGGGLVLTEFTSYDVLQGDLDATFAALMPVVQPESSESSNAQWTVSEPSHPVVTGLPSQWRDPATYSVVQAAPGAQVIAQDSASIPLLTEKAVGAGKVIHLNQSLTYDTTSSGSEGTVDPHALALIHNAAAYTAGLAIPSPTDEWDVLLLGDSRTEVEIAQSLFGAGFKVAFAGRHDSWDGVFPSPAKAKSILFFDGYLYGLGLSAAAEQSLSEAVGGGKGLVVTEWTTYDLLQGDFSPTFGALLPVVQPTNDDDNGTTWMVENPDHPILEGLPSEWFDTTGFSNIGSLEGAEVLVRSGTGIPMVTTWDAPGGPVVHLNHGATYTNGSLGSEIQRLIVNSLRFVGGILPSEPTADLNGNGEVEAVDLLQLIQAFDKTNDPADLDGNGTVGVEDLYLFSAAWKGDGTTG